MEINELFNIAYNSFDFKQKNYNCDDLIGTFFLTLKLFDTRKENIYILTKDSNNASKIYELLLSKLDVNDIIFFTSDELIRVEYISESKDVSTQQIISLYRLINAKHKVIICTPKTAFRFYPSKETFLNSFIKLEINESYNIQEIINKLISIGYSRVKKIDQSLQFALRGDILDIYTLNYENPVRIEFFDDTIESIRFFNIFDQMSYEKIDRIEVLPATINLLSDEEKINAVSKIESLILSDIKEEKITNENTFRLNMDDEINIIKNGPYDNKFYKFMGVLQGFFSNLTDFAQNEIIIFENKKQIFSNFDNLILESNKFLKELTNLNKCPSSLCYFSKENSSINKSFIEFNVSDSLEQNEKKVCVTSPTFTSFKESYDYNVFDSYLNENYKIFCYINNLIYYRKTYELVNTLKLTDKRFENIVIENKNFPLGLEFKDEKAVILTENELYGIRKHHSFYKKNFKEAKILNSYEELEVGDYVVHENYGVGIYFGINTLEFNNIKQDYMEIHYANDEKLFVPLYQFNFIRKFVGRDGKKPTINKLNSLQWEKTKKKIKEKVNELADRLLLLYQERENIPGHAFEKDDDFQRAFENEFSYELTPDQKRSVEEIKLDMEKPHPMDRLLCGDVGFGKTEVAFRAVFKALINGKQVAFLCPTTLLARQHYELAIERFKNYDFGIGIVSRLQTSKENKETLQKVKEGKINFVIGTHRLLSKDVVFKNLGLLVIDEEQRFGVEQKEIIKEKSKNIDVLALSATPIPRTLQSTLVGLKTTSNITTPPKERMPIQTYVIPFDDTVLKEIIERELSRNGQTYLVHNDIYSIYKRAEDIKNLVPNARIGVIHAKMNATDIENTMLDFYDYKLDILVTTTIIENGIDVRNANLIIIDNADHFGLAQLYQIKGRVGRGDKMAFAYLLVNQDKKIGEDASKRLKTITEFTELGSGLKISQRDLLIRGAGNILGPEQAGFIDAIGIDLYIKILNETIDEKKSNKNSTNEKKQTNILLNAYVPDDFADNDMKLEIYQTILDAKNFDELEKKKAYIVDIYGKIPEEVEKLLLKRKIDIYVEMEEFESVTEFENQILIKLSFEFSNIDGIGSSLFTALIPFLNITKITYVDKKIQIGLKKEDNYIDILLKILNIIVELYNGYTKKNEN